MSMFSKFFDKVLPGAPMQKITQATTDKWIAPEHKDIVEGLSQQYVAPGMVKNLGLPEWTNNLFGSGGGITPESIAQNPYGTIIMDEIPRVPDIFGGGGGGSQPSWLNNITSSLIQNLFGKQTPDAPAQPQPATTFTAPDGTTINIPEGGLYNTGSWGSGLAPAPGGGTMPGRTSIGTPADKTGYQTPGQVPGMTMPGDFARAATEGATQRGKDVLEDLMGAVDKSTARARDTASSMIADQMQRRGVRTSGIHQQALTEMAGEMSRADAETKQRLALDVYNSIDQTTQADLDRQLDYLMKTMDIESVTNLAEMDIASRERMQALEIEYQNATTAQARADAQSRLNQERRYQLAYAVGSLIGKSIFG